MMMCITKSFAEQRDACLIWASEYGHPDIVTYLLNTGMDVATQCKGMTALHAAAFGGQVAIVRALLERHASMEVLNDYGGTVLGQTLWSLYNNRKPVHLEIMEILIAAGAIVKDEWRLHIEEHRNINKTTGTGSCF